VISSCEEGRGYTFSKEGAVAEYHKAIVLESRCVSQTYHDHELHGLHRGRPLEQLHPSVAPAYLPLWNNRGRYHCRSWGFERLSNFHHFISHTHSPNLSSSSVSYLVNLSSLEERQHSNSDLVVEVNPKESACQKS